ncbi:amidohydrolase [Antrihabitans sp. YC2-6]|uniref:amidohydrolase family protein n=1 Tax=Antrihabitans sp. YC2-6 TaxID=2799498 RepID=UPI0018F3027B|nr:amidohydrolase family protein [Antrihabitans sp. YC2-6]MBJ8346667.1 amidohydrolase family protein [Antrihabitans sp. YC2-6]
MTDPERALPDFPVIDPHIHQWDPFTSPRTATRPAQILRVVPFLKWALLKAVPASDREFIGNPDIAIKPYLPDDYTNDAKPLQVSAIVHIEAGWHGKNHAASVDETRWVAALPFGGNTPKLGAIVVHADPTEPDIGPVLDAHLAASNLVRGVRCTASHHPDPGVKSWAADGHLLTSKAFLTGFAALAERRLSFELWLYSHQLPDAVILAREYPETTFVLDHYATPVGLFGPRGKQTGHTAADRADILKQWRDEIGALAELPNVVAKHSGLGMPILGGGPAQSRSELTDAFGPLVTYTQELFGPDRTLWASNFPMDKPTLRLSDSVAVLQNLLADQLDPRKMFRDNAARVYAISV